jgi:hypothetical protein
MPQCFLMMQHQFSLLKIAAAQSTLHGLAENDILALHLIDKLVKLLLIGLGDRIIEEIVEDGQRFVHTQR